jgi:hypothetical protein
MPAASITYLSSSSLTRYKNTMEHYQKLNSSSRDALYLGLVPTSAFIERRNDGPYIRLVLARSITLRWFREERPEPT